MSSSVGGDEDAPRLRMKGQLRGESERGSLTTSILPDAAVLLAAAPAALLFLGWSWKKAYLSRLGVRDTQAYGEIHELMVEGFWLLVLPVLAVGLILVADWVITSSKREDTGAHDKPVRFLAVAAAASMFIAGYSISRIGDDTPQPFKSLEVTMGDLLVLSMFAAVAGWILFTLTRNDNSILARFLSGGTPSGGLFLVLLTIGGLTLHADAVGTDLGADHAWGCTSFPAIQVDAPGTGLPNNTSYLLAAHAGGAYYLRDTELPGDKFDIIVVPEGQILSARLVQRQAIRSC